MILAFRVYVKYCLLLLSAGTYRGVSFIIRFSHNYLVQLVRTHQAYGPTSNQDIEHINITWSNDQSQMVCHELLHLPREHYRVNVIKKTI